MNESQKHCAEQKKSDTEKCILTFESEVTMAHPSLYLRKWLEIRTGS